MVNWATVINGRYRDGSLRFRSSSDIFDSAGCFRNWASLIVALRAALLLSYRPCPIRSGIRTRTRVQGPTNSGIPLAHVACCYPIRCQSCLLHLRSALRSQPSEVGSTTSEIGVTFLITLIIFELHLP